jgi:hypothetical protein
MNIPISSSLRQQFLKCAHSILLVDEAGVPSKVILDSYKNLFNLVQEHITKVVDGSYKASVKNIVSRELIHSSEYTFVDSLRVGSDAGQVDKCRHLICYLTPLNLNIRVFREKANLETSDQVFKYLLETLIKFAATAFPSIALAKTISEDYLIQHIVLVDTEPVSYDFLSHIFTDFPHLSLLPLDHSSCDYSTDKKGRKAPCLEQVVSEKLCQLKTKLKVDHLTSVNIDADDILSVAHPLLLHKYLSLTSIKSSIVSTYICFPLGLQLSCKVSTLYSYSGTSNCFMSYLSSNFDKDVHHVWKTGHDTLDRSKYYTNVSTWFPVWIECIWGSNISNKIWPSALELKSSSSSIYIQFLFGVQIQLVHICATLEDMNL